MEAKVEADAFYQRQADEVRRIQGSLESAVPLVQGIQAALADAPIYIEQLKNKDLVLVLGVTGAGKSVLINYLKGCDFTLETDEETGRDFVRPIPGHENRLYAKPGETPDSQTYYPQAFAIDADAKEERVTYYCDCPGHADTNQDGKAPASRLLIHQAIKESSSIRGIIMCVPFSSHDTRERDLRDMLIILDGLFRDTANLNVPMIFVATKAGGKNTQQFLNNLAIFRASQEKILLTKRERQTSPAEIAILEKQIHLLDLMTAENTLVVNPTKGEASREAFREKLGVMLGSAQRLAGIDKSAFYISPTHGDQQSLMRLIVRIMEDGIQWFRSGEMMQAHAEQQEKRYRENIEQMVLHKPCFVQCAQEITEKNRLFNALSRLQDGINFMANGWGIGLQEATEFVEEKLGYKLEVTKKQLEIINNKNPEQNFGIYQAKLQALQKAQVEIQKDLSQCEKQFGVNETVFKSSARVFQFALEMGKLAGFDHPNFRIFEQIYQTFERVYREKNVPPMHEHNADPLPNGVGETLGRIGVLSANNHTVPAPVLATAAAPCFDRP